MIYFYYYKEHALVCWNLKVYFIQETKILFDFLQKIFFLASETKLEQMK